MKPPAFLDILNSNFGNVDFSSGQGAKEERGGVAALRRTSDWRWQRRAGV